MVVIETPRNLDIELKGSATTGSKSVSVVCLTAAADEGAIFHIPGSRIPGAGKPVRG